MRNASGSNPVQVSGALSTPATLSLTPAATALINAIESIANDTVVGNVSGSTGVPSALTQAQLTALVNDFTSSLSGAVPASGGGTSNFLRADGILGRGHRSRYHSRFHPRHRIRRRSRRLVNDAASPGNSFYYGTDGSGTKGWYAGGSGASGANPSASVGLSAVDGSATTFLRSDGAPALSQAISPTWTGNHTFSAASGTSAVFNGVANSYTAKIVGSSTSPYSFGLLIEAGTTSADNAFSVTNQANSALYFLVRGDGSIYGGGPATWAGAHTFSANVTLDGTLTDGTGSVGTSTYVLSSTATGVKWVAAVQPGTINFIEAAGWNATGGAIVLSLTVPQDIIIPYGCTLQQVYITTQGANGATITGSCTVTIGTAAFPGSSFVDITGGAPPVISSASSYSNTTLMGWTTSFAQNAQLRVTLSSVSNFYSVKIHFRFA